MIVLDSSAMLAYLKDEEGADVVAMYFEEADVPISAHAINLAEVFYDISLSEGEARAEEAIGSLKADGVNEGNDMDPLFWRDVARLIVMRRAAGAKIALGDACGLALARRLDAVFVTADNHEMRGVGEAGLCEIQLIRPQMVRPKQPETTSE